MGAARPGGKSRQDPMGRVLRYLFYLALLGVIAFVVYTFFTEPQAPEREIIVPLDLPGN